METIVERTLAKYYWQRLPTGWRHELLINLGWKHTIPVHAQLTGSGVEFVRAYLREGSYLVMEYSTLNMC